MTASVAGLSAAWTAVSICGASGQEVGDFSPLDDAARLPALSQDEYVKAPASDWLIQPSGFQAGAYRTSHPNEIALTNGLIRRAWRLRPNAATVGFDNLMTGASILRAVKPEAYVKLDWQSETPVGGLVGQPDGAFLKPEWLDRMTADPSAFRCTGFHIGRTKERFPWKRTRFSGVQPWPPPGESLTLRFDPGELGMPGITVFVHYEMLDGIPLLSKWVTIHNQSGRRVRLNRFVNEVLAAVGIIEVIPPEAPLTLFVWGVKRVLPVRLTEFSITEEAYDPGLNPIRAKVGLGMRVLNYHDLGLLSVGGGLFMAHQVMKEVMATIGGVNTLGGSGSTSIGASIG